MSELDRAHLRKTAEAATQGEWLYGVDIPGHPPVDGYIWSPPIGDARHVAEVRGYGSGLPQDANGRHIAKFDPPTILKLLKELDEMEDLNNSMAETGRNVIDQRDKTAEMVRTAIQHLREKTKAHINMNPCTCSDCLTMRSLKEDLEDMNL